MERHGYDTTVQVEMDALDPAVLRGLYAAAVEEFSDAYRAVLAVEEADRAVLAAAMQNTR
jgi:hypothetical protein